MKITIYTVSDCQFSKQEKEYLQQHNLPYEEKNLEQNREWLTEMLAVSNNFAGTPVTKIEKDDGQIVVLKGFTKEEFDKTLGFEEKPAEAAATVQAPVQAPQPATPPSPPPAPTPTTPQPPPPSTPPPTASQPPSTNQPISQTSSADPLNSILDDLQVKAAESPSTPTTTNEAPTTQSPASTQPPTAGNLPNIPEPDFK